MLDANVLMDAARDYYAIDRVPEFWEWLQHLGDIGRVKIPAEVHEEVKRGTDELAAWVKRIDVKASLLLSEEPDPRIVSRVARAYAPDLTDEEIVAIGRSRPSKQRQNRQVPDVCSDLGVSCKGQFDFIQELDFRTNWSDTLGR